MSDVATSLLADPLMATGESFSSSGELPISERVRRLRETLSTGKTKSYDWRIAQLRAVHTFLVNEEKAIISALHTDLGRSKFEAIGLDVVGLGMEIEYIISNLKSWMRSTYTDIPAMMAPGLSEITHEPFGVVLVMGAFNYPISLTLGPLVGAIAAGNVCLIKPSEMASKCEALLRDVFMTYVDTSCFSIVCGGIEVNQQVLQQRFDKIFFTGSPRVGKIVMKAAAEFLTPVSLELGGKSPTIVDETVSNMHLAVTRILWGKFANAGQTCIAPDYLYVHETQYELFLETAKKILSSFYGVDADQSPDFGRIISSAHCARLQGLLPTKDDSFARIAYGGRVDVENRYVEPTILIDVEMNSKVMSEEIFGPILPVFKYKSLDEIVQHVVSGEKPLVMYIFSKSNKTINKLTREISSGGVLVNDTLMHFGNIHTPFGGVGHSGMGGYHGKFSFECFSHRRTIFTRDSHSLLDVPVRYPPYSDCGLSLFKLSTHLPAMPACISSWLCCCYWRCSNCSCCDGHEKE